MTDHPHDVRHYGDPEGYRGGVGPPCSECGEREAVDMGRQLCEACAAEADRADAGHTFETCPDCDGDLGYPSVSDVICQDCDALFTHEIRGSRHFLWRFSHDEGLTEVVERVE